MKIAVDTCIGRRGVQVLRDAGHEVVVEALEAEPDRQWFARALAAGVELVVSPDSDIEILAYDNRVEFFKARRGKRGVEVAARLVARLTQATSSTADRDVVRDSRRRAR